VGDTKFRQTGRRTHKGPYRAEVKERKQREAVVRQDAYTALSHEQKVRRVLDAKGQSLKQRKQLGMEV
jgi:hypothetical protein